MWGFNLLHSPPLLFILQGLAPSIILSPATSLALLYTSSSSMSQAAGTCHVPAASRAPQQQRKHVDHKASYGRWQEIESWREKGKERRGHDKCKKSMQILSKISSYASTSPCDSDASPKGSSMCAWEMEAGRRENTDGRVLWCLPPLLSKLWF
jgi:hypothetical protein